MTLENVMKRAVIGATMGIALKGIKADSKRSIRNTLDLFDHFTAEIFDKKTLNKIRCEADNTNSSLYKLIMKTAASVDNTMLKTIGTNLCCNRLILFPTRESGNTKATTDLKQQIVTANAINDIVEQGINAGAYFYVITGNEPFQYKEILLNICHNHNDCVFYIKTNGKDISDDLADEIVDAGNIILAINIDKGEEPTELCSNKTEVFKLLQQHRCLYGFNVMGKQARLCFNNGFVNHMISLGCSFGRYSYEDDAASSSTDFKENPLFGIGKPILLITPKSDEHFLSHFAIGGRCYISFGDTLTAHYKFPNIQKTNDNS